MVLNGTEIIGFDIGNSKSKDSRTHIFDTKASKLCTNILNPNQFIVENEAYYMGEGDYDNEYQKIKKENYMVFLLYGLALNLEHSKKEHFNVVVGLPLSQYSQDRDELKNMITKQNCYHTNYGKIYIDDAIVYPEGAAAVYKTNFQGVIVDIGARTTDCCIIELINGLPKIKNAKSFAEGTLNLYADFINLLNAKYTGLGLDCNDAEYIIENGLKIYGEEKDISNEIDVFRIYVNKLVSNLMLQYPVKTKPVKLIGGGSKLLSNAIHSKIPNAELIQYPVFANALGYERIGEEWWS